MAAVKKTNEFVMHKDEVAAASGLSMASIDRAIQRGDLKTKKYGSRTLILREEVARFLHALPDQPPSKAKPR